MSDNEIALRQHRETFRRHGFNDHAIDFSDVKPEAIAAMANALEALETVNEMDNVSLLATSQQEWLTLLPQLVTMELLAGIDRYEDCVRRALTRMGAPPPLPYARGMQRLVGNARCSECTLHKPALTCFDNKGGSSGWTVCDDCLRRMLP